MLTRCTWTQIFSFCLMLTPDIRIGPRPVLTRILSGTFSYKKIFVSKIFTILICVCFLKALTHNCVSVYSLSVFQFISVLQPTFKVQRLSFAFFSETKRSSEMNVSSSTWKIWIKIIREKKNIVIYCFSP